MLADRPRRGVARLLFVSTNQTARADFSTPAQIRQLDQRGHIIGSHSASHPTRFSACSPEQMRDEWTTSRPCSKTSSVTTCGCVRPAVYRGRRTVGPGRGCSCCSARNVTSRKSEGDCTVAGRFTIRRGDRPATSAGCCCRLPARWSAWTTWNIRGEAALDLHVRVWPTGRGIITCCVAVAAGTVGLLAGTAIRPALSEAVERGGRVSQARDDAGPPDRQRDR